jgi:hypothetical protein
MPRPLSRHRVLDLWQTIAGPMVGRILPTWARTSTRSEHRVRPPITDDQRAGSPAIRCCRDSELSKCRRYVTSKWGSKGSWRGRRSHTERQRRISASDARPPRHIGRAVRVESMLTGCRRGVDGRSPQSWCDSLDAVRPSPANDYEGAFVLLLAARPCRRAVPAARDTSTTQPAGLGHNAGRGCL